MEVGLGALGLPPDDFWSLTYVEFQAKYDGWRIANGHDASDVWTNDEVEHTKKFISDMKKKMPDGKPSAELRKALKEIRRGRTGKS